jgi:hypothetical protein
MAQLNVRLKDEDIEALKQYAQARRTPVAWLIRDYIEYLVAGGHPVAPPREAPTPAELAVLAQRGGSFDWLADEPELYSLSDGEPV